jgi:hypothetical protein
MKSKRKKVESYIYSLMNKLDSSKNTTNIYKNLFKMMSDKQFQSFMEGIRDGDIRLIVILPNMKNDLKMNDIERIAEEYKVQIFDSLLFTSSTGRKYTTNKKYLILNLPVRRVKQYLFNKISLPESDERVNVLTGQVMPPDKGSKITDIETKILANKDLDTTILELIKLRGGDTKAYQEMKRLIEDNGTVSWDELSLDSTTKSVVVAGMYLNSLMLEHNLGG